MCFRNKRYKLDNDYHLYGNAIFKTREFNETTTIHHVVVLLFCRWII